MLKSFTTQNLKAIFNNGPGRKRYWSSCENSSGKIIVFGMQLPHWWPSLRPNMTATKL